MSSLSDMRESRGCEVETAAEHLGVSKDEYLHMEENPDDMSIQQVKKLCMLLSCGIDELFPVGES